MNQKKPSSVIDTFTRTVIEAPSRGELAKILNIPLMNFKNLLQGEGQDSLHSRYVRNDGKTYWTTIIDFETGEEFDCVNYKSLCLQLNRPFFVKDAYGFRSLKFNKGLSSMVGRTFYLKDHYPKRFVGKLKNIGPKLESILEEQRARYKITSSLRDRIRKGINRGKGSKSNKTEELIGCKIDFFLGWIEKQFTEGMTWENHGLWHIDHIKPCNTFNMLDVEEQKKCFHYTNCRPLWAYDNLSRPNDGSDIVIPDSQDSNMEKY